MAQAGKVLQPGRMIHRRHGSGIDTGLVDRTGYRGHAGDMHMVRQLHVSGDAGGAGNSAVGADIGGTGDARAAGYRGVRTDMYIVRNMNLVIQLDTIFDHGIANRAAIDRAAAAPAPPPFSGHESEDRGKLPETARGRRWRPRHPAWP